MPIVDVELVCESKDELGSVSPRAIADAVGRVFGSSAGSHVGSLALLRQRALRGK